jgi:hypothetical protein
LSEAREGSLKRPEEEEAHVGIRLNRLGRYF